MLQEIVTYLIIAVATVIVMLKLYKKIKRKPTVGTCENPDFRQNSGCSSCESDCPLKNG